MQKVALVTGSSSGIGFETALALAKEGYYTYASMRDTKKSKALLEKATASSLRVLRLEQIDMGLGRGRKRENDRTGHALVVGFPSGCYSIPNTFRGSAPSLAILTLQR